MKTRFALIVLLFAISTCFAQNKKIQCGPMLGAIEKRSAEIWIQLKHWSEVEVLYWPKNDSANTRVAAAMATDKKT